MGSGDTAEQSLRSHVGHILLWVCVRQCVLGCTCVHARGHSVSTEEIGRLVGHWVPVVCFLRLLQ